MIRPTGDCRYPARKSTDTPRRDVIGLDVVRWIGFQFFFWDAILMGSTLQCFGNAGMSSGECRRNASSMGGGGRVPGHARFEAVFPWADQTG